MDTEKLWKEYQSALDYQTSMGFTNSLPKFVRFAEGEQWPAPTEKTKYMPRPVVNQCDFILENKLSNILSQSLKMVYSVEERPKAGGEDLDQAAEDYTDAAENTWHDIDQDTLNEDFVSDALLLGTGVYHAYFDNSLKGGKFTPYIGKIQGEIIDPLDVFFGNPHLKPSQTQKQPWIKIRTREDVDKVIEHAKKNGQDWQNIKADDNNIDEKYDSAKKDIANSNKVTCIIDYRKKNGAVYWTKITKNAVVQKEIPLAPDGGKPFELYPIEPLVLKKRHKCTYGRSFIADVIPNQQALNWGLGMMLLSVQQTAWPKIIAKVGALLQTITNEPGEIITDNNPNMAVDGIKYMQTPNFSQMPMQLTEKLLDITRQVTGTTEVTAGEVIGANMAAAAIIALQNQAKKPNEGYQSKLFRSIKNIGRIWEEFYKCYYNLPRPIKGKDKNGNEITKQFIGNKYAEMQFGLKIDVGPASIFNESLQVSILDKMYEKGDLNKYQYVKYLPKNAVSQELSHDFEQEEEQLNDQQQTQGLTDEIINSLTPEELAELQNNPQLLNEAMGGMNNGMPQV